MLPLLLPLLLFPELLPELFPPLEEELELVTELRRLISSKENKSRIWPVSFLVLLDADDAAFPTVLTARATCPTLLAVDCNVLTTRLKLVAV